MGGDAQRAAYRSVAGHIKLAYAQFEELEGFARFGASLDAETRASIDHGLRIRACLKQPEGAPVAVPEQIAVLLAVTEKLFDSVPLARVPEAERGVMEAAATIPRDVRARFETATSLSAEDRKTVLEIVTRAVVPFVATPPPKAEEPRAEAPAKATSDPTKATP